VISSFSNPDPRGRIGIILASVANMDPHGFTKFCIILGKPEAKPDPDPHQIQKADRIRIVISAKKGSKMEPWRAVDAHKGDLLKISVAVEVLFASGHGLLHFDE
jgi:hypothetical protein